MNRICSQFLILTMVVISGASLPVMGQDARFSQFFTTPQLVNPAFTSLFQGDYQVSLNYRSQWRSVMDNPYSTIAAAGSMKVYPRFADCDYVGLGFDLLADRAGALSFGTVQANVSAAYYKSLNGRGTRFLGLGFTGGVAQRSLNYDPATDFLEPGEALATERFGFADVSAGLVYSHMINREAYWYAGGSMFHLNTPEQGFLNSSRGPTGIGEPLDMRYVLHGGGNFPLTERWHLRPSVMWQRQGAHMETVAGGFLKFETATGPKAERGNAVHLGAFYRLKDALLVAGRLDFNHYYLTISYDVTTGKLTDANYGAGGLEISLAKALFRDKRPSCPSPVDCPLF